MGRCAKCNARFVIPIPDPQRLLDWAESSPWHRLSRFVQSSGAAGHGEYVIEKFVQIVERRRWAEQDRERFEAAKAKNQPVLSHREKIWARSDRQIARVQTLEQLRELAADAFEQFIADLLSNTDYTAEAVGRSSDNGIDVKIYSIDGALWGVAQCKRYGAANRVSAGEVRDFAGAFMLTNATHGLFFTTGKFTRHAKRTAAGYDWLKTYNGTQLVDFIANIPVKPLGPVHH